MFINSINQVKKSYSFQTVKKNSVNNHVMSKSNVNFMAGPNQVLLENKAKIMASLDIMSKSPKIKAPESELERKAILEVLEQRLKLNKYIRLRNEARSIRSEINEINKLVDSSKFEEAKMLLDNLDKKGNIDAILKTIDKQIEQEEKRNQPAIKYFEDLDEIMSEYLDKKIIKYSHLDKYCHQAKKNSINPSGDLSTAELIEFVKSGEKVGSVAANSSHIMSRKDLLLTLEKEYEYLMRKGINVYATVRENEEINNQYDKSRNIRYQLNEKYGNLIKRYPGISDALRGIYAKVEKKYSFKVNQLSGVDIYPIGEIWDQMKDVEKSIKNIMEELPVLKEKLGREPENKTLEMEFTGKQIVLAGLREDWMRGVKHSLNYESINRQRMMEAGHIAEYDYLTTENKTLNKHKLAMKIYNENNETIPEEYWSEILK